MIAEATTVELCNQPLTRAAASYAASTSAVWGCNVGSTDTTSPAAVDVLLGITCAATVSNGLCAGVACDYDHDCPDGYACNDATGRCFSQAAGCVGLPCGYDHDCPDGLTCNGAIGQCIVG